MPYLSKREREALRDELKKMKFSRAQGKLRRLDPKGRLVFYRNFQRTGRWETRYDLVGLGTRVILVETHNQRQQSAKIKGEFELVDVIVEPMPENRT